jgi:hypothetical protein
MDANYDSFDAMSYSYGQYENNVSFEEQPKYEMRAPPRRRKDTDEQPLFLRKAYTMVTNCPIDLGSFNYSSSLHY